MSLLDSLGLHRKELRAWAMYDWANSAMVTTIVTAIFPIYFASVAAADLPKSEATYRYALATTLALAVIAVLAPILGAIADHAGIKKRLLGGFLVIGVAAVAADVLHRARGLAARRRAVRPRQHRGERRASSSTTPCCPTSPSPTRWTGSPRRATRWAMSGGGLLLALNLAWIMKPGGLRASLRPRPHPDPGHPADPAGLPLRGGLVGGVLDPALPPRARAAGDRRAAGSR